MGKNDTTGTESLTAGQVATLKVALTLSQANGFARPGCTGAAYRSLEARGLMASELCGAPTNKGGGWRKRVYRLTDAGRLVAESILARTTEGK